MLHLKPNLVTYCTKSWLANFIPKPASSGHQSSLKKLLGSMKQDSHSSQAQLSQTNYAKLYSRQAKQYTIYYYFWLFCNLPTLPGKFKNKTSCHWSWDILGLRKSAVWKHAWWANLCINTERLWVIWCCCRPFLFSVSVGNNLDQFSLINNLIYSKLHWNGLFRILCIAQWHQHKLSGADVFTVKLGCQDSTCMFGNSSGRPSCCPTKSVLCY